MNLDVILTLAGCWALLCLGAAALNAFWGVR